MNNFVALVARRASTTASRSTASCPSFVIQGGCPEGTRHAAVPGYKFADEPVQGEYTLGAVAMANAGPNTNGSQFFISIDDCTRKLTKSYNLFGYVVEGMDVALATQVGDVMRTVNDRRARRLSQRLAWVR